MSFYATISGYVLYRTRDHLAAVVQRLISGRWLNTEEQWILQGNPNRIRSERTIDYDRALLVIPPGHYRNLARITTELFAGATAGRIVISSTDGCFDAWIEEPIPAAADVSPGEDGAVSTIRCIDLMEYAVDNDFGARKFTEPEFNRWQTDVLASFHDEFDPDVFAILESSGNQPF